MPGRRKRSAGGRPRISAAGRIVRRTALLTPEQCAALMRIEKRTGASQSRLIRDAVDLLLAERGEK